jgi:hypothetical protein
LLNQLGNVSLVAKVNRERADGENTTCCAVLNQRQLTISFFFEQDFMLGVSCCSLADLVVDNFLTLNAPKTPG